MFSGQDPTVRRQKWNNPSNKWWCHNIEGYWCWQSRSQSISGYVQSYFWYVCYFTCHISGLFDLVHVRLSSLIRLLIVNKYSVYQQPYQPCSILQFLLESQFRLYLSENNGGWLHLTFQWIVLFDQVRMLSVLLWHCFRHLKGSRWWSWRWDHFCHSSCMWTAEGKMAYLLLCLSYSAHDRVHLWCGWKSMPLLLL